MALHVVSYSLTRDSARKAQAALRVAFFRAIPVLLLFLLVDPLLHAQSPAPPATAAAAKSIWRVQEFMVPMRDGVHLQTVVIYAEGSNPAAADSPDTHSVRRADAGGLRQSRGEERRRLVADELEGARRRRIHLRLPESARTIQVRRRLSPDLALRPERPQAGQRDQRCLRHHRLAGEKCSATTTAKWASTASPTTD